MIALIKPQFEVGRDRVGKGGVVKNPALHEEITQSLAQFFETSGFRVHDIIPSPITGPKGNKEFFVISIKRFKQSHFRIRHKGVVFLGYHLIFPSIPYNDFLFRFCSNYTILFREEHT